jgi:hypothetical protein
MTSAAEGDLREEWYCPLLGRTIEAGLCLDINYQRLGYFEPDVLLSVMKETKKSVEEVSAICEACPNLPLRDEDRARPRAG